MAEKPKPVPPRRPPNPAGNPGWHPSTKGTEHTGSTHTSKMR